MIFNFLFKPKKPELEELRAENERLQQLLDLHEDQWVNAVNEQKEIAHQVRMEMLEQIEALREDNASLIRSLEFHEEQWMNTVKELDHVKSRLKKFEEPEKNE